ncbi:hypothetical protein [Priestia megaterium]|nr:hypothetical protein [Priestia megaterium]
MAPFENHPASMDFSQEGLPSKRLQKQNKPKKMKAISFFVQQREEMG